MILSSPFIIIHIYSAIYSILGIFLQSKNFAIAMRAYDLLGHSTMQLITGWSNGKIDCRAIKTGEVLFKDSMSSGVSGIAEGDYRSIGKADIICVASEGEGRDNDINEKPTKSPLLDLLR